MHQVKHEIDRDLLGTKKPNWDQSVGIIGNEKAEEHTKTLFDIKRGLKDEKIGKTIKVWVKVAVRSKPSSKAFTT